MAVLTLNSPELRFHMIVAGTVRFTQTTISQSSELGDILYISQPILHSKLTAVDGSIFQRGSLLPLILSQRTHHRRDAFLSRLWSFRVFDGAHPFFLMSEGELRPGLFGLGIAGDDFL